MHQSIVGTGQAEFAEEHPLHGLLHGSGELLQQLIQLGLNLRLALHQRAQGFPEHAVVGLRGHRLVEEAEVGAPASPGLKARIEQLAEPKRAVVEGEASGGAVVAVEIALAVANPDPVGHQGREAITKQARQQHNLVAERQAGIDLLAVIAFDQVRHDQVQLLVRPGMGLTAGTAGEQLQLTHPQKRWRHPGADGRRVIDHHVRVHRA